MSFADGVTNLATRVATEINTLRGEPAKSERINAATLATRVSGDALVAGAMYQITDAPFIAVATSANTYDTYRRMSVGSTAPASPITDDLWVDTT